MNVPWIQLEGAVCFAASGRDAKRYLHNRLSNDIHGLLPGGTLQAAALSAQGRVEGLFLVQCLAEDRFVLVADGGDAQSLQAALGKFIVADRVVLENITPSVKLLHVGLGEAEMRSHALCTEVDCLGMLPARRIAQAGSHLLVRGNAYDAIADRCRLIFGDPITPLEYHRLRWRMGLPIYPTEVNDDVILTECGMRDAVSFAKGCYVGQEVLERCDAIGRLPRILERIVLEGAGDVPGGASVTLSSGEQLGKVVSSVSNNERSESFLFALLKTGKYSRGDVVRCMERVGVIVEENGGR
jgi:folate-binding protein YgfZ